MIRSFRYGKPLLLLSILFAISLVSQAEPIDPWGLLSIRRVAQLLFALSFIQVLGDLLFRYLDARAGALALGFLGGLVSSTALTISLAKKSQSLSETDTRTASIAYLSATLAMLGEALLLVYYGSTDFQPRLLLVFVGPIAAALAIIGYCVADLRDSKIPLEEDTKIDFVSILKLSLFIIGAIGFSKLLERLVGIEALLPLTFLVSLFEIHGSVIANVQLHDADVVSPVLLGDLLCTSFVASFLSKLFIASSIGNAVFKRRMRLWSALLVSTVAVSWAVFRFG